MSKNVARIAEILDLLGQEPLTSIDLAKHFDIHRSTMFRELQSLEQARFVRKQSDGRYALGMQLASLGSTALEQLDLRATSTKHIRRLHAKVGNTIHLGAYLGSEIVYADKVEEATGVRMYSRIGASVRPHCSSLGKAVLAELPVERRDELLASCEWKRYTPTTLTSRRDLDAELTLTSKRGWSVDNSEFEDFVVCVAVPIKTEVGVVGALSLTALKAAHTLPELETQVPKLKDAARLIAGELR